MCNRVMPGPGYRGYPVTQHLLWPGAGGHDGNDRPGRAARLEPVTSRPAATHNLADLARLRRARDRMDREYAEPLDVPALARTALMSPAHFSRRFREAYSETPYSYLMTRRIERAKALLRRGDLTVTEVCFAVGSASLGSFSARFTEIVGETPSEYRARGHEELQALSPCQMMVATRPRRNRDRAEEIRIGEAPASAPA